MNERDKRELKRLVRENADALLIMVIGAILGFIPNLLDMNAELTLQEISNNMVSFAGASIIILGYVMYVNNRVIKLRHKVEELEERLDELESER